MTEIIPWKGSGQLDLVPSVGRRLARTAQAAIDAERIKGLVGVARAEATIHTEATYMDGAAWLAHRGQTHSAVLAALEQRHAAGDPVAADRYARFTEAFVTVGVQSVLRMGMRP
ncbi:hypothetical protein DMH04_25545 [Kibdelosporangium aridum]|uniref:Uncharacterized protein n=1 Tax=Kibdelosporangium aridum TaxID=2030 RepID=A0A428Z654_KIBAR|nr:hypothetical protein [Kibdelosporangium aridum]RSM82559.1 hypothetical protein DMH04_25545 [Kibdelosporangium aridum]